jgi:tetratricopeptide (TPR) repeat protein/O-antigen ligase
MGKKSRKKNQDRETAATFSPQRPDFSKDDATHWAQKSLVWWLPILYFFISDSFYLRTYDSAQVKITLVQMGGVCMLALWLIRLLGEDRKVFTKTDLVTLAPFLAFFGYGIFSYMHAPYKFSSTDAFLRLIFYMTVPLVVIREFNQAAVQRLIKILIFTTWVTAGYGFLQWFDIQFFPPGIGKGPDPFIWRQAFGYRVFSTFGNPNFFANFLVIMSPIVFSEYLKTKNFKLIPLLGMIMLCLVATKTKGAWVGMVVSVTLYTATYAWFFNRDALYKYWRHLVALFLILSTVVTAGIVYKLNNTNWTSVTFRLFTWLGTWEMVMTQPVIGTGIGSFWVIYPAFRRPPIFHIEGKHNTETDHAENEWLEVLYDMGILGFGIFLWLLWSTWFIAYRSLGQMTGSLKKAQRAPPRAYNLLGFLIAMQGMLAHNLFDVSMRFVSSGVYLGLLSGIIINLSRGSSLSELHRDTPALETAPGPSPWKMLSTFLIWPARLGAWAAILWIGHQFLTQFHELQGPLRRMTYGGEILQWWIAWAAFLFCVLSQAVIFARSAWLARNALIPIVIVIMVFPLKLTWGFFRADVHHNIAIFFSKKTNWEQALKNYLIVGKLNPAFVMSFYFKGNVFNDRFDMARKYNPNWGDVDGIARNDYERAHEAYAQVRSKAPNYVQMHHQVGVLYMKRGQHERNLAANLQKAGKHAEAKVKLQESESYLDKALEYFALYRSHDPVFSANYYRMAQIHHMRGDIDKMLRAYEEHVEAKECNVTPGLMASPLARRTLLKYMAKYPQNVDGKQVYIHRHDTSDGMTNLGNGYTLANKLKKAGDAYRVALIRDPKNVTALNNLKVVLSRAKAAGRLELRPGAGVGGLPNFEITPAK